VDLVKKVIRLHNNKVLPDDRLTEENEQEPVKYSELSSLRFFCEMAIYTSERDVFGDAQAPPQISAETGLGHIKARWALIGGH
jgi:hypothetical protein